MAGGIGVAIIILLTLAFVGSLIMWSLWHSIKRRYNSNGDEVPMNMIVATAVAGFCAISPPLIIIVLLLLPLA